MKSSIPLPFCNKVNDDKCKALRVNHNLFTQCTNKLNKHDQYCKTCLRSCIDNKPKYGTIYDRLKDNWIPPKGKSLSTYIDVLDKLNISQHDAIKEASRYNLIIPSNEFIKKKKKTVKRGRPKRTINTKIIDPNTNLIEKLVKEAYEELNK